MPKLTKKAKQGIAAGGTTAALIIASFFIPQYEGEELIPYLDSVGVQTVCSGETRVIMRVYTKDECAEITRKMVKEFTDFVLKVNPDLEKYPWQLAAHSTFAVNIGKAGYNKSSIKRLSQQGDYVGACRYLRNYKYAGGRIIQGLVNRREGRNELIGEYEVCLVDAVPAQIGAI